MADTLLQIVKNTLASMGSDPVDTIFMYDGGTEESEDIAGYADQLYTYLYSIFEWENSKIFIQLNPLGDSEKPNYLQLPDNIGKVYWFKYRESDVLWRDPKDFIEILNSRNTITKDDSGVETSTLADNTEIVLSFEGIKLYVKNNAQPTYYTSFDGKNLVFDSYDKVNESTLQNSNSSAYVSRTNDFLVNDTFVPDLPDNLVPLFQAELNREAHLRLKQIDSPVDAKRALTSMSKQRTKNDRLNKKKIKGFGRK